MNNKDKVQKQGEEILAERVEMIRDAVSKYTNKIMKLNGNVYESGISPYYYDNDELTYLDINHLDKITNEARHNVDTALKGSELYGVTKPDPKKVFEFSVRASVFKQLKDNFKELLCDEIFLLAHASLDEEKAVNEYIRKNGVKYFDNLYDEYGNSLLKFIDF